jgi:hypothetical protein
MFWCCGRDRNSGHTPLLAGEAGEGLALVGKPPASASVFQEPLRADQPNTRSRRAKLTAHTRTRPQINSRHTTLRDKKVRPRTATVVAFLHTQDRATCYRGAVIDVVRKQATSMTQQQCLEKKRGS